MFCGKCGTENRDNTKFCANCGEPLQNSRMKTTEKGKNHRLIGIVAVALAVAIVLTTGLGVFGGRSAKRTADQLMEALTALDLRMVYELYPKPVQKMLLESHSCTKDEYMLLLSERNEDLAENFGLFGGALNWDFKEVTDVPADSVQAVKDRYKQSNISISDVKAAVVELSVSMWGIESSNEHTALLVKYKGAWYVDYDSVENLLS